MLPLIQQNQSLKICLAKTVMLPLCSLDCGNNGLTILYFHSTNCLLCIEDKSIALTRRSVVFLRNDVSWSVRGKDAFVYVLSLRQTEKSDLSKHVDLRTIVDKYPELDLLFEQIKPFFILNDVEQIHIMIGHIIVELCGQCPGHDDVIRLMLQALLLKCVRSAGIMRTQTDSRIVAEARTYIMEHFHDSLSVSDIAEQIGISRSYLDSLFSRYKGRSVMEYINHLRIDDAAFLLSSTNKSITEISVYCGFNSRQRFASVFEAQWGFSPRDYRKMFFIDPELKYQEEY